MPTFFFFFYRMIVKRLQQCAHPYRRRVLIMHSQRVDTKLVRTRKLNPKLIVEREAERARRVTHPHRYLFTKSRTPFTHNPTTTAQPNHLSTRQGRAGQGLHPKALSETNCRIPLTRYGTVNDRTFLFQRHNATCEDQRSRFRVATRRM